MNSEISSGPRSPAGRRWRHVLLVFIIAASSASASAFGPPVRLVRIDGTKVDGKWVGSPDGRIIRVQTADGPWGIALDELYSVDFQVAFGDQESTMPVVFYLADGGHLYGELLENPPAGDTSGGGDRILARTVLSDALPLGFDRLAGVQLERGESFPRAEAMFRKALASRSPGYDSLVTRSEQQPQALRGRLDSFDTSGGLFVFAGRARKFQAKKIFGIVFAAGASGDSGRQQPVSVTLVDGSVCSGRIKQADGDSLRLATSLGVTVDLPLGSVTGFRVRSSRVVYVSSLSPSGERAEGLLHRPWPARFDRSVTGGVLSSGGRRFEKGVGVHSRAELEFSIDGAYEKFAATIGIDDAVRPRGGVVFRVLGDGKTLFDSGLITGADPVRDIIVDVSGVTMLTLSVDYGDGLDLADAAVWGDARLLKPRTPADEDAS